MLNFRYETCWVERLRVQVPVSWYHPSISLPKVGGKERLLAVSATSRILICPSQPSFADAGSCIESIISSYRGISASPTVL